MHRLGVFVVEVGTSKVQATATMVCRAASMPLALSLSCIPRLGILSRYPSSNCTGASFYILSWHFARSHVMHVLACDKTAFNG